MFNGPDFPAPLEETVFGDWLEKGREAKIGYNYLLIIWDEAEAAYRPVYAQHRDEAGTYESYRASTGRESLVAVYDLYSESRISS